jgi:hypothetical protein
MARRQILTSADDVIEWLGGTAACARLTGTSVPAVCNWRNSGRLPARRFHLMRQLLLERGAVAPPSLWSQHSSAAA